jgi:hypothetical protein
MKISIRWSRILVIAGLTLMVIGVLDPLEGSVVILAGSLAAAMGAFLGKLRRWKLLLGAFVLIVVGVGVMFAISSVGGIGGRSDRSMWWALIILPYPVGWIAGLTGAILCLKEFPNLALLERRTQPFAMLFIMDELDCCGAEGASLIEVYRRESRDDYRRYIDRAVDYILHTQHKLDDGTWVRPSPNKKTLWADDLY